jgi:O-antigen biosynthesis protein
VGELHADWPSSSGERVPRGGFKRVDVIICIHNALERVALCLESVIKYSRQPYTLYLVNDGSDERTSSFLRDFSLRHKCSLVENPEPLGYTRAANLGMSLSGGDYCLFLNSDTTVSSRWLDKLVECAESHDNIGLVGPLSNAAAYQSVPFTKNEAGQWIENSLPEGTTPEQADKTIDTLSQRCFPRVPFLNGFCLLVKRGAMSRVGCFDEVAFPRGYGEEIDYCLRAGQAGMELAVADHVYVFHARSASYGHQRRVALSTEARGKLDEKHGAAVLAAARDSLYRNKELELIRQRIAASWRPSIGNGSMRICVESSAREC